MKIKKAYSLMVVIFAITFLSTALTIAFFFISNEIHRANNRINQAANWKNFYEALDMMKDEFEKGIKDDFSSPFDGWFPKLPTKINDFDVSFSPEDSRIDINHIDFKELKKILPEVFSDQTSDKLFENYFYNPAVFKDIYSGENFEKYRYAFSLYCLPNLNTANVKRVEFFGESIGLTQELTRDIISKMTMYRLSQNYMTVEKLLINQNEYELVFKPLFPREKMDQLYVYFDYKGTLNLNFISKEVLDIGMKLCYGSANISTESTWKMLETSRASQTTIRSLQQIFMYNPKLYEKLFSVDSNLFRIEIKKGNNVLTALFRRYKNFKGDNKIYILSTNIRDKEIE